MRRKRRYIIGDLREYAVRAAHRRTGAVRHSTGFYDRRKVKRGGGTGVRRKRRYIIGDLREYAVRAAHGRTGAVRYGIGDLREYAVRAAHGRTGSVRHSTGFYDRRKARLMLWACGASARRGAPQSKARGWHGCAAQAHGIGAP